MTILSGLAIVLIGWPGIITALVLVSIGIYTKRILLIVLGTIFSIPISWYLGSSPIFRYIMYALPMFFIGSAIAIKFGKHKLAWILIIPYVVTMVWLGFTVLSQ